MKMASGYCEAALLLVAIGCCVEFYADASRTGPKVGGHQVLCPKNSSCPYYTLECPDTCPEERPLNFSHIACFADCWSTCTTMCKYRKPNCSSDGAICYEPRFIGGDGIMFYFHGKSNQDFSIVSDKNLQINAHFIGKRPPGRPRDYTWVQSIGIMFGSHTFTIAAKKVSKWDDDVDQLVFSFDNKEFTIPAEYLSVWNSPSGDLRVERTNTTNSILLSIPEMVEAFITVVPVTEKDSRIHNYQIPSDDCFAHLAMQFKFFNFTSKVDGILGQTYRPGFKTPVKVGVPMPIMGGDDKFRASSLLSADCKSCIFSPHTSSHEVEKMIVKPTILECSSKLGKGDGVVCRR